MRRDLTNFAVELLPGAFHIPLKRFVDARGTFVKTHATTVLASLGVQFTLREEFYSISAKDVIRGMHYQRPPHDHDKIVYCPAGRALDVLLDLRPGRRYGDSCSVLLDAEEPAVVFIPAGIAHGFKALVDGTTMVYKTSTEHAPTHDAGVRFDSFGFDWECDEPVLSDRDLAHPLMNDVVTPFWK